MVLLPASIFSVLLWLLQPVPATGNPCCSFPCQNNGVCLTTGPSTYICDCSNLEFYGDYCQHPTLMKRVKSWLRPSSDTLHYLLVEPRLKWLWDLVNYVRPLHDFFMGTIYVMRADIIDSPPLYHSSHEYPNLETVFNLTVYSRILPPVPRECPTPMGVKGPKELPDIDLLIKKFFTRKKFLPDPIGSNVLFTFFAQHFTHMFFKTDFKGGPDAQWGGHGVDVSNIYGGDKETENRLRLFSGGKLKMQIMNGEEYPMTVAETGVKMTYPEYVKEEYQLAVGHPFFGLLPGLLVYSTIWMREHNRVCDILAAAHPEWDDERLFQTARLVILGEHELCGV
ncbi:hypothetical protein C0Q70_18215 [Pomacea canaliculata]|uniref:prostaglandin-endoperoxide synthase n=1 Tax=Pomacea canaliculata TaxID=400727 RepID=A0A2T7NML6_POMCA|nr:hypothetical protein C0Q70_18215 [Pomacea canaliculata]